MRAPILGVAVTDPVKLRAYVRASTEITHSDPKAYAAALAVALAECSAAGGEPVAGFARAIGSRGGISGYSFHTVPCVLQVWFRFADDFAAGLTELVEAGGDTDTAGAIFGGIAGARSGRAAIPEAWRRGILEWPRSLRWIEALARSVSACRDVAGACPRYFWPGVLPRNAVFLLVVLAHGLRRLLPPY